MKLDAVSLVVKYSHEHPNLLVTGDGEGKVYIANCLRPFDLESSTSHEIPLIEPESNLLQKVCLNKKGSSNFMSFLYLILIGMINPQSFLLVLQI